MKRYGLFCEYFNLRIGIGYRKISCIRKPKINRYSELGSPKTRKTEIFDTKLVSHLLSGYWGPRGVELEMLETRRMCHGFKLMKRDYF